MRSALRYSMVASRYCSCLKYRSPRSRYRAFLASGERAQPAVSANPLSTMTARMRMRLDIWDPLFGLFGQIVTEDRIERLDVPHQSLRGFGDASLDRARDTDKGPVGPVPEHRAADHRDLGVQLPGDHRALGLEPVDHDLHLPLSLDEVAVDGDRSRPGHGDADPGRLDRLPAAARQAVLGGVDI